jgi:hypothetical protein
MRAILFSFCLVSALFSACSSTDDAPGGGGGVSGSAGSAGSGGKAAGGAGTGNAAGEGGTGGADDSVGAAGDAGAAGASGPPVCLESGTGDIDLIVDGLPKAVAASVTISGPHDSLESESTTLGDVPGGTYSVTAKRVYDADPLVRTAYDPQISPPTFCLDDGGNAAVTVTYTKVTPSNQLWTLLRSHGGALQRGFTADTLTASGSPDPATQAFLPIEYSMAFDHAGDLWGVKIGSEQIARYAPHWLGGVGEPHADYQFNLALDECVPPTTNGGIALQQIRSLALDASENIWLSVCDKKVLRIDRPDSSPGSNEEPVDIAPNATLSGFTKQTEDLAFDSAGNLWVAAGGQLLRFDHARLTKDDAGAPDLILDVTTDETTPSALSANFLAFDVTGNLWATDVAGHALFEITKTDLAGVGTQTVVAKVRLALGDSSSPRRPAFDGEGSLWVPLSESSFGKLTEAQLAVSSTAAAPTIPSVVIGSVGPDALAFFPAASGLPLPSAQP